MDKIYIRIERSEDGYFSSYAENVTGIYGQGGTVEEAKRSALDGIELLKKYNSQENIPEILKREYKIELCYGLKANELRVGNKVECGGKIFTVEEVGRRGTLREGCRVIIFKEGLNKAFLEECGGVELTDVMLEEAGFAPIVRDNIPYYIEAITLEKCPISGYSYKTSESTTHVKYLHQLQNLYFDLITEDLDVKL